MSNRGTPRTRNSSQSGLATAIFLVVALIALVVGAMTYMSRGNNAAGKKEAHKTNAILILKQGSDIKNGFDRMVYVSGVSQADITLDAHPTTGLFNPARKIVAVPAPPPNAFSTAGPWQYVYNRQVQLPQVGSASGLDFVVALRGLSREVCIAINHVLHLDSATASPASSSATSSDWAGAAPAAVDESGNTDPRFVRRPEGCVQTSDGSFVYFKALAEDAANSAPSGGGGGSFFPPPVLIGNDGKEPPPGEYDIPPDDGSAPEPPAD